MPPVLSKLYRFSCTYGCKKRVFRSSGGLQQHINCVHAELSSDSENEENLRTTVHLHPHLTGTPVDKDGKPLPKHARPALLPTETAHMPLNPWAPFNSRLEFDFAYHHYVDRKSPKSAINTGLDLWLAAKLDALKSDKCEPLPWANAEGVYATIDQIQEGVAPFHTVYFQYKGPLLTHPPAWMTTKFELCVRDARQVLPPYQQYDSKNERVFSNLMSGNWPWREATKIHSNDPSTDGAMLVPVVSGLNKTTVSVATGSQEYHPFYISLGNLSNAACRGHVDSVIPVAFLPIPKETEKRKDYQRFARQLYHECIAYIFSPLRAGMTTPEIVQCPDGHLRRAVYSIGPVIADYPEQVWLSGIVQGWCPKCLACPENLDDPSARRRTHEKTDFAINTYSPTEIWERFRIRDDVVPFTHHFPQADIHELMAPDLLHQLIKGTFKDHIVTWVNEYIHANHPEARALEIIQDIDRRISGVPTFPGLRRFKDGRDFNQWTGDDSKALMKVYIAAIAEYVPERMVQCLAVFMNICYILRRNAISASALTEATAEREKFHELRSVFVEEGSRQHTSLPRQHALSHFIPAVQNFGSPNGLCSSITESRHITAVKEPWRQSNRFNALPQMLTIIVQRMLEGTTAWYTAMQMSASFLDAPAGGEEHGGDTEAGDSEVEMEEDWRLDDVGPVQGPCLAPSVKLSQTRERLENYPRELNELAAAIQEPQFVDAFLQYLHEQRHPTTPIPDPIQQYLSFSGRIYVHHSAVARFFAPSDACGSGGMQRKTIRCNRYWKGGVRRDTILVSQSDEPGMYGMIVARLRLLFEFCALVQWFPTQGEEPDPLTGLWKVAPEEEGGVAPLQVISLSTIVRGVHLLPVYGKGRLPESYCYTTALDKFQEYYVNSFIDHHAHELLVV
ncbi:hypothetical protein FA13DRAFT_1893563 [Coprinellus micaceus]|uniref:C2H2-type domain-containing protein n=1 Tax=Coprinellus micaceus TaxID=71717 RepID=A0A4Y7TT47_COPMI|nr:hypothetical protein FA13DRAFT_1893563 [Coprinellus micaceus]